MTVSRVLNNRPDVSEETRQRILAIIEEQGYKPHALARKLSGGKTNIVGVALYIKGNPIVGLYVEVLQGLQAELAKSDYDLLLLAPSKSDRYDKRFAQTTILDGLVLMGNWTSQEDILHLRDSGIPFITIGRRSYGDYTAPFVAPAYEKSFNEIVDFAVSNGAHKIAVVITGLNDARQREIAPVTERLSGIETARKYHNLAEDAVSLISSSGLFADGYNWLTQSPTLPDAIVLDSTEFSFGVALALRDRKLQVHQDVRLLGLDYENAVIHRCENVLGVPIPSWTIPWLDLGRKAAQHLLRVFESNESGTIHEYINLERRNLYVL